MPSPPPRNNDPRMRHNSPAAKLTQILGILSSIKSSTPKTTDNRFLLFHEPLRRTFVKVFLHKNIYSAPSTMSFENMAQGILPAVFLLNSFIFQLPFDAFQVIRIRVAIAFWSPRDGCFMVDVIPCNDI